MPRVRKSVNAVAKQYEVLFDDGGRSNVVATHFNVDEQGRLWFYHDDCTVAVFSSHRWKGAGLPQSPTIFAKDPVIA